MLFVLKRRFSTALLTLAVLLPLGLWLKGVFGVRWDWEISTTTLGSVALAVAGLLAGDAVIQWTLNLLFGSTYADRYAEFVAYGRRQGPLAVLSDALLAAFGEEPLFRGVVLSALLGAYHVDAGLAVAASTVAYAAAYTIPNLRLNPFTLWKVWEGGILGVVYILTGSLFVAASVHALHSLALGASVFGARAGVQGVTYRIP